VVKSVLPCVKKIASATRVDRKRCNILGLLFGSIVDSDGHSLTKSCERMVKLF